MKIYDIISEATPKPSRVSVTLDVKTGKAIDPTTGEGIEIAEFMEKFFPAEASRLKKLAQYAVKFSKSASAVALFGVGVPATEWAYEMSVINFLWESGAINATKEANAGTVAQQYRVATTRKYMSQILATLALYVSISAAGALISRAGAPGVKNVLSYLLPRGGKSRLISILTQAGLQALIAGLMSIPSFREYLTKFFMESIAPEQFTLVAQAVGGKGERMPAWMSGVLDSLLSDAGNAVSSTAAGQAVGKVASDVAGSKPGQAAGRVVAKGKEIAGIPNKDAPGTQQDLDDYLKRIEQD